MLGSNSWVEVPPEETGTNSAGMSDRRVLSLVMMCTLARVLGSKNSLTRFHSPERIAEAG